MKGILSIGTLGLLMAAALVACGGSGSTTGANPPPPPSATPRTTVGVIAGFGSVYVNGIEFDTNGSAYEVDDEVVFGDDALAVGMVVKIQGSVGASGLTGFAESVSYDDDIEGIVTGLATDANDPNLKTFDVLGVTVQADKNGTNFDNEDDPAFSFDTIMDGDHVEVSGEFSGDVLIASYIEKQDAADDDFEAKGTVDQFNGSDQFVLVLGNDSTINVTVAAGAQVPPAGIENGQFVEVEGTIPDPVNAPDSILATKVELEDDDRIGDGDDDEVEVKGTLNYDMDAGTWSVMGVELAFDDNTEYSPESLADAVADQSAAGLYVEVEGQYVNDVLQVHEIELEEDDLEFKGDVETITVTDARDGIITLSFGLATGTVEIRITPDTMFLNDESVNHYDLNSIMVNDKLEIDARLADDGTVYASSLHLEDDMGYAVEAPMDEIDDVSITVFGVGFMVDMDTIFENGTPVVGDYVEVEDDDADGIADSVEIED